MIFLARCLNRDLKKLLLAQIKAEISGRTDFICPVCGGRAVWNRETVGSGCAASATGAGCICRAWKGEKHEGYVCVRPFAGAVSGKCVRDCDCGDFEREPDGR